LKNQIEILFSLFKLFKNQIEILFSLFKLFKKQIEILFPLFKLFKKQIEILFSLFKLLKNQIEILFSLFKHLKNQIVRVINIFKDVRKTQQLLNVAIYNYFHAAKRRLTSSGSYKLIAYEAESIYKDITYCCNLINDLQYCILKE